MSARCVCRKLKSCNFPHTDYCVAVEGGGGGRFRSTSTEVWAASFVIHWLRKELDILCAVELSGEFQVKKKKESTWLNFEGRETVTSAGQNIAGRKQVCFVSIFKCFVRSQRWTNPLPENNIPTVNNISPSGKTIREHSPTRGSLQRLRSLQLPFGLGFRWIASIFCPSSES